MTIGGKNDAEVFKTDIGKIVVTSSEMITFGVVSDLEKYSVFCLDVMNSR